MHQRKISLAVALLMTATLFGCAKDNAGQTSATTTDAGADNSSATELATEYDIPQADYEGFEFRILARDNNWDKMEVDFDEPQEDVIYNAVYERNRAVEEKLSVKITGVMTTGDIASMVKKSYNAGDNDYDIVLTSMADSAALGREGYLRNWNEMPGVDITNSWWDQNIYKDLSINGKMFYMAGELNIRDNDNTWIMLFNKKLITELALESPYNLVKENNWTFDKLYELGKAATLDLTGDAKYDQDDRYGLITTSEGGKSFFYGAGLKVVDKDSAGVPQLSLKSDRTQEVLTKIDGIFNDQMTFYKAKSWEQAEQMFANDKGLFYSEIATHIINLRYMDTDFGILPIPKYNAEQPDYYTHVASNGTVVSIPDIIPDEERTGAVIEALGFYGQKYLTPAFNDVALKSKYSRDEDSRGMLDIIWKSVRYDIGYLSDIGGMSDITTKLLTSKKIDTFLSTYESKAEKAQQDLDKLIADYNK